MHATLNTGKPQLSNQRNRSVTASESKPLLSHFLEVGERVLVRVRRGSAWATLEGDPEDHVVEEGSPKAFVGPGLLVVEPLGKDTAFQILPDPLKRVAKNGGIDNRA